MIQIFHGFAALSKNPATQNTHDVQKQRATTISHHLTGQYQSVSESP